MLKEVARLGFDDLDHGRFTEIRDDSLGAYIADLGRRTGGQ